MGLVDFSKHKNWNSDNIYGLIIKIRGINFLLLLSIQYILANFASYLYNLFRNQHFLWSFFKQNFIHYLWYTRLYFKCMYWRKFFKWIFDIRLYFYPQFINEEVQHRSEKSYRIRFLSPSKLALASTFLSHLLYASCSSMY